jgi:hypothetical protein
MASFRTNEEFFQAARDLVSRLERKGHREAAAALRDGFGCLNGLTDGWALFLEAIEDVRTTASKRFDRDDQRALKTLRAAAHAAVHRR